MLRQYLYLLLIDTLSAWIVTMDLRRARSFVTVVELGTVSKAAQHLHVAQPALSRQLHELEHELGFKLFNRAGRGLVLTGEGEQLLPDCRGLLNYAAAVHEKVQLLRGGDIGVLKVAASPQFIEGILAEFLHHYATLFPGVEVKLREALGWGEVQGLLERGDIHIGQSLANAVPPYEQRFESHHLMPLELLLAFHPKMAPTLGNTVEIRCLAKYPLLVLDTNYANRRMLDAACRLAGLEPTIAFESRTPHTLIAMAERGHGVAVIPSTMCFRSDLLRVAQVTFQKKRLREPLAVFWDRRHPLPRYAIAFCRALAVNVRPAPQPDPG
jgi:DNA-binding transcriptional LysR family regulator